LRDNRSELTLLQHGTRLPADRNRRPSIFGTRDKRRRDCILLTSREPCRHLVRSATTQRGFESENGPHTTRDNDLVGADCVADSKARGRERRSALISILGEGISAAARPKRGLSAGLATSRIFADGMQQVRRNSVATHSPQLFNGFDAPRNYELEKSEECRDRHQPAIQLCRKRTWPPFARPILGVFPIIIGTTTRVCHPQNLRRILKCLPCFFFFLRALTDAAWQGALTKARSPQDPANSIPFPNSPNAFVATAKQASGSGWPKGFNQRHTYALAPRFVKPRVEQIQDGHEIARRAGHSPAVFEAARVRQQ